MPRSSQPRRREARDRSNGTLHAQHQRFRRSHRALPARRGRSVDAEIGNHRFTRTQNGLICRNFLKPSNGVEPFTPSLQ